MNSNTESEQTRRQVHASRFSIDFRRLAVLFTAMEPPYPRMDALAFASLYRAVYQSLTLLEWDHAESMVGRLMEGMAGRDLLLFHSELMQPEELTAIIRSR